MRYGLLAALLLEFTSPAHAAPPTWTKVQFGLCYEAEPAAHGVMLRDKLATTGQLETNTEVKSSPGELSGRVVTAINGRPANTLDHFILMANLAAFFDDPDSAFSVTFEDSAKPVTVAPCLEALTVDGRRYAFDRWNTQIVTLALYLAVQNMAPKDKLRPRFANDEVEETMDFGIAPRTDYQRVYAVRAADDGGYFITLDVDRDDRKILESFAKRTGILHEFSNLGALGPDKERLVFHAKLRDMKLRHALLSALDSAQIINQGAREEELRQSDTKDVEEAVAALQKDSHEAAPHAMGPDAQQLSGAVDQAFRNWAQRWVTDQYVDGSAKVEKTDCNDSGCVSHGNFTFVRAGAAHSIEFSAEVTCAGNSQYQFTRLCYNDSTSGMRECTQ